MCFIRIVKRFALPVGSDAIDDTLVASADQQPSLLVENKRPYVFHIGMEKLGHCGAVDAIHLSVGRRSCIKNVLAVDGKSENIELRKICDERALACGIDFENLPIVTRAQIQIALRICHGRPDQRLLRIESHVEARSQNEFVVARQRQVGEFAFSKFIVRAYFPKLRRYGEQRNSKK